MKQRNFAEILEEFTTALKQAERKQAELESIQMRLNELRDLELPTLTRKAEQLKSELALFVTIQSTAGSPQEEDQTTLDGLFRESVDLGVLRSKTGGTSIKERAKYLMNQAPALFQVPPRNADLGRAIWISKWTTFDKFPTKDKNSLSSQIGVFIKEGLIKKYSVRGSDNDIRLLPSDWEKLENASQFQAWIDTYELVEKNETE